MYPIKIISSKNNQQRPIDILTLRLRLVEGLLVKFPEQDWKLLEFKVDVTHHRSKSGPCERHVPLGEKQKGVL